MPLEVFKSKLERAAKKRKRDDSQDETPTRVKRQLVSKEVCLFYGQSGNLHEVMTLEVDEKVRQMATDLQDSALLKRLAGGDVIAIEAKYHKKCMKNLSVAGRSRRHQHKNKMPQLECTSNVLMKK